MGRFSQVVAAAAAMGLIVAAVALVHWRGWFTVSTTSPPAPRAEPGVLRYPPGSALLSAITVKPVEVTPVPLAEPRRAIRVPSTALVTVGLYNYVFVERSPGVFARRRVGLAVEGRDYSYVETGVEAGERIVVVGAGLLSSELASGH